MPIAGKSPPDAAFVPTTPCGSKILTLPEELEADPFKKVTCSRDGKLSKQRTPVNFSATRELVGT
jgi:hypothetical protein